jgi:hypothetical protein
MSFEGEIGEIDLIEKLVEMGREQFTGAIRFENDGIIKIVYFKTGDILSASTNDRSDSIDEILLRAGKVTREHVKQALSKRKETETLGDAMLGLGFITRKELTWARRAQAIGILRSLRGWEAGQYTIVADYLPKREEGTLFPLAQMLVELIVTETDRSRFDKATDGGSAIFQKTDGFDEAFRRLGLNQDAEDIAVHIDGRNSAADVAAASGKDAFNVYKLLEALRALGLLSKSQAFSHLSSFDDFSHAGVADAADAWTSTEETPAHEPSFALDDEPALTYTPAQPQHEEPSSLSWDEPPQVAPGVTPAASPMPAWDEPRTREIPVVTAPPATPQTPEPQWGFDEAQIETARRAAVPLHSPQPDKPQSAQTARIVAKAGKPNRVVGVLLGAVALMILVAAGWFGYGWYLQHHAPEPLAAAAPVRRRPHFTPTPQTTTAATTMTATSGTAIATATGTGTAATSSTAGSMAPPPGALVVNPTPTTTTIATTTLPPNTATTAGAPPATPAHATTMPARPAVTAALTHTAAPAPVPATHTAPPSTAAAGTGTHTAANRTPAPAPAPAPASGTARLERPAAGNAMITNSGSGTSGGTPDATRAKYDAMARESAASGVGSYTLQFELVCETSSLTKAIAAGSSKVWFTPLSYRGRSCYRVYWGRYASAAEATAAMGEIPASLRESKPVVVHVTKP